MVYLLKIGLKELRIKNRNIFLFKTIVIALVSRIDKSDSFINQESLSGYRVHLIPLK